MKFRWMQTVRCIGCQDIPLIAKKFRETFRFTAECFHTCRDLVCNKRRFLSNSSYNLIIALISINYRLNINYRRRNISVIKEKTCESRVRVIGAAIRFDSIQLSSLHPIVTWGGNKRLLRSIRFCSRDADISRPPARRVRYPLIFCTIIGPLILRSIKYACDT